MERTLIKAVGILFQGVVQVVIDATIRAERAEQQAQALKQQLDRQAASPASNVSVLPSHDAAAGG